MIFDGDCALCHASVRWVKRRDQRGVVSCLPSSAYAHEETGDIDFSRSVVVRTEEGETFSSAEACGVILAALPQPWSVVGDCVVRLMHWRFSAWILDSSYFLVANNRLTISLWLHRFGLLDSECIVPSGGEMLG